MAVGQQTVAGVLSLRGDNVTDLFWDLAASPEKVQIELAWAGPWVGLPLPVISPALGRHTARSMALAQASVAGHVEPSAQRHGSHPAAKN